MWHKPDFENEACDLCLMWAPRYQAVHRQVEEVKKVVDQTVTGSLVQRRFCLTVFLCVHVCILRPAAAAGSASASSVSVTPLPVSVHAGPSYDSLPAHQEGGV